MAVAPPEFLLLTLAVPAIVAQQLLHNVSNSTGSCNISLPRHGNLGNCTWELPSGSACLVECNPGYSLNNASISCDNGRLSNQATCIPSPCNLSGAPQPENGAHSSDCFNMSMESGAACEIVCNQGWSLRRHSTCSFGRIEVGVCVRCGAGHEYNSSLRDCQPCSLNTYKGEEGAGPCLSCPVGSTRDGRPADSPDSCVCNSSTFREETADPELFFCKPCPDYSVIPTKVREGHNIKDCKCEAPYSKEVFNSTTGHLERCRLPRPCNLTTWLQADVKRQESVGKEEYQLKLGTCEQSHEMVLQSGTVCQFECRPGTAPQLGWDFFTSISRTVACLDGEVTQFPPLGTWCSEGAWKVPPLVFLGAVTTSAIAAICDIERRQRTFEQELDNPEVPRLDKKNN